MNEMKLERSQVEAENIELKENELDEVNGGFSGVALVAVLGGASFLYGVYKGFTKK